MKTLSAKILAILLVLSILPIALAGCGNNDPDNSTNASNAPVTAQDNIDIVPLQKKVKFTLENGKTFVIELLPQYAPNTCKNFLELVNKNFYDGLIFHRLAYLSANTGFIVQGGDAQGTAKANEAKDIYGEFSQNGYTKNTLAHTRGVVSMARLSNNMNSASSQFFICVDDVPHLDGGYATFGKIVEGFDTIDWFKTVEVVNTEPASPIIIEKTEVLD